MSLKITCTRFCRRLTGKSLRILVIRAGFPYHKAPLAYQWLWVFILLPFLDEDSLNELCEKHGKPLRQLYPILRRHPQAFERLVHLLSVPLFFTLLTEFDAANEAAKSRQRLKLIVDDTKAEKFGTCQEFLHKLFDHCQEEYMMGYNYVLLLVVSGPIAFPLSFVLWLPQEHPEHRSKNEIVRDELIALHAESLVRHQPLSEVEFLGDSAFCAEKVFTVADAAGLRIITKPGNRHKFAFEGERLTPKEIMKKVAERQWHYLDHRTWYQRVMVHHHAYGDLVLIIRQRHLKNGKTLTDALICNTGFYTAVRIHKGYRARWDIELHFKYYKQYLGLGHAQFGKIGSIRSQLACVALAGLLVALFRRHRSRRRSFRQTVKQMTWELRGG
jgi:hypothetical protein